MNEIIRDGGFRSRKLWYSVFATGMVVISGLGVLLWAGLAPLYDTMVGGIVAIAGLYLTGSVATKWVGSKVPAPVTAPVVVKKLEVLQDHDEDDQPALPPAPRFTEDE